MPSDREPVLRHHSPRPPEAAAASQIRYIRKMMERTTAFTGVSGRGGMVMGVAALGAAVVAVGTDVLVDWMRVWTITAITGFLVGAVSLVAKARRHGLPLLSGQGQKFLLCLAPALIAGAALTLAVYSIDVGPGSPGGGYSGDLADSLSMRLLPGMWLLLYGAGVVAAGIFSVKPIPILGAAVMITGILALMTPAAWANAWMATGFGALHIVMGFVVARTYGG